jgi:hypothetical protein
VARLQLSEGGLSTVWIGIAAGARASGPATPPPHARPGEVLKQWIVNATRKKLEGSSGPQKAGDRGRKLQRWDRLDRNSEIRGMHLTAGVQCAIIQLSTSVCPPADGTLPDSFSLLANLSHA